MYKNPMFWRLISRAVWFRKLPSIVAVLAIMLGTGVIGGLVHVYYDMNQKMGKEFRTYGANLLLYPSISATPMTPKIRLIGTVTIVISNVSLIASSASGSIMAAR